MKPVARSELLDFETYREGRVTSRAQALAVKDARRIRLEPYLTFLFENRDTVRYQIQEMMLAERLVREADIAHELETYNELLGGPGELGATLLVEIESPAERDRKLREWLGLPSALYLKLPDGARAMAQFDARQVGTDRLSAVQYLKFDVHGQVPVALGSELSLLKGEVALSPVQREALRADLSDSGA